MLTVWMNEILFFKVKICEHFKKIKEKSLTNKFVNKSYTINLIMENSDDWTSKSDGNYWLWHERRVKNIEGEWIQLRIREMGLEQRWSRCRCVPLNHHVKSDSLSLHTTDWQNRPKQLSCYNFSETMWWEIMSFSGNWHWFSWFGWKKCLYWTGTKANL